MKHIFLKIRNITRETSEAVTIQFEHPQNEQGEIQKLHYEAGQFLTFLLNINGDEVRRSYSFSTSPDADEYPAVTVKAIANGKVSNLLNKNAKVGDVLETIPPAGNFTKEYNADIDKLLILFGGGSGVTPLFSLLKTTLLREPNTKIALIYANKNQESVIFDKQLEDWQKKYNDRFQIITVLEKAGFFWNKGYKGFLDTAKIEKILGKLPKTSTEKTEYFMCGPEPMMKVVEKAFKELKLPLDKLKKEVFVSPSDQKITENTPTTATSASTNTKDGYNITLKYDGEVHTLFVPHNRTILQSAMSQNIDLPYSCQSGMCTACMGKCTSGQVKLTEEDALTPKELAQGFILTCVGHPVSEGVVIEVE